MGLANWRGIAHNRGSEAPLTLLLSLLLACSPGADGDGDGFAAPEDCNDADAAIFPGAEEICDGWDNDCDGRFDLDATDAASFFVDADGDGFGNPDQTASACAQTDGLVPDGSDCDDGDAEAWPGAPEDCAATADRNCDGHFGTGDADGDGFAACEECDDRAAAVAPGAEEACDGVDADCDGFVDEGACNYTYGVDIQPIWDRSCAGRCHVAPAPSGELDLTAGYDAVVGAPSRQSHLDLIAPGSLEDSYLVHKLYGTHASVGGSGTRMPKTGSLDPADLAVIEVWILDGAAR